MIKNWLKPSWETGLAINDIPKKALIEIGIKAIILDVDGTLLSRQDKTVNESVLRWIKETNKYMKLYLLSNNTSRSRISDIAIQLDLPFTYKAFKPRKKEVLKAIDKMGLDISNTAMIGDRVLTDIFVGNRIGLYTILVKPIKSNADKKKFSYIEFILKKITRLTGEY